jgi:AcrR family transcriptional regulator
MAGTRAQRRLQILDELLVLIEGMLDGGEPFSDISVERLASSAGMSRTRFYLYFEDKNDLIMAWFGRIREGLAEAGGRWWAAGAPPDQEALTALAEQMLRAYRPHATLMAAVEEVAAVDPAVRARVEAAIATDTDALREHIQRGQSGDAIDADLDADAVARWLTLMHWRGRRHLLRGAGDAEIPRVAGSYSALLWNVLYAGPPVSSCGSSPSR